MTSSTGSSAIWIRDPTASADVIAGQISTVRAIFDDPRYRAREYIVGVPDSAKAATAEVI